MKVHELLSDESKWCTVWTATDAQGNPVHFNAPEVAKWSLWGAFIHCYWREETRDIEMGLREQLIAKTSNALNRPRDLHNVWWWSDAPERTFAEVRALALALDI